MWLKLEGMPHEISHIQNNKYYMLSLKTLIKKTEKLFAMEQRAENVNCATMSISLTPLKYWKKGKK